MSQYESEFAIAYDRLMDDMPYERWVEFVEKAWHTYGTPETIVELGCGTGNVTLPLARTGKQMIGIDLSADMLTIAREKWERQAALTPVIEWLEQDMCEWQSAHLVDAVVSFCDSINYLLEPEQIVATFESTWRALKPGGIFIFDVRLPEHFQQYNVEQPFVLDEEDIAYIWHCDYDEDTMTIEHLLTIFSQSSSSSVFRRFEERQLQRAYEPEWLESVLRKTGFTQVDQYADFSMSDFTVVNDRLFFVAIK
ncbi:class I SAM-dependent DNA methyltransferase [Paenibacillus yanchengensis]|uniref:Class I SAM-dependent DNA methyltransferase n=1 Tax=Paenibacillus yanchengensis TaxID=2035833 RepID=A0ABW4YL68_9BACL